MLVLETQGLRGDELAGVEVLGDVSQGAVALENRGLGLLGDLAVVGEQLLKVLGAEDVDLGQEELALDERAICVVEHGPDGDQVLELAAGLLDDAVLAREDNGHAGEVLDLGAADDEGVNVEAAGGEDARDAREHTRLVLDQAVEDVALGGRGGRGRGLVEDVGDGGLGGPRRGRVAGGQRLGAAAAGLVGHGRGRAARVPSRGRGGGAHGAGGSSERGRGRLEKAAGCHLLSFLVVVFRAVDQEKSGILTRASFNWVGVGQLASDISDITAKLESKILGKDKSSAGQRR